MGNQHGKQRSQYGRYIDWERAERPTPPGKPYLSPDGADLPDIITIRWAKPMSDGGAPILGYLVEHRRTGSPHWLRASPQLAPNTELVLTGLEPGWRYQFRVSAENDIGRSDPGELSEPLTVLLQRSAASAPHFNRELYDTIALENETVELTVHVLATPAPKIAWYKDGFELFSSRRTKIVTENETSTLIIYQAALEDEGEIKCTATNRAGHAVTKANLRLEAPPRIRLPRQYEDGLLFEKGETMRLKITTAGRPPPSVTWYHNSEPIVSKGRIDVTDTDHGSGIRILDACRNDRGEYMVRGSNKIGEDCVTFLVTITDKPSPPSKPQVVMTLGRSVTLSWTAPDDDGGCRIGNFIVEYFRIGWDMWLKAATSRQLTAQLADLITGSEYKFRIKAENPYGISDPSEESDVVFIPDPKRGILKPEPRAENELWSNQSSLVDGFSKKDFVSEPETEAVRKRRILEENAKKLLDSPQNSESDYAKRRRLLEESAHKLLDAPDSSPFSVEEETDFAKRRRLLEENASRLLDTPLDVLLAEGSNKLNTIEKPPRRKLNDSIRSSSASPIPDYLDENAPPVPKRRAKHKSADFEMPPQPSPLVTKRVIPSVTIEAPSYSVKNPPQSPFLSSGTMSPALLRDDSITHGSSELMLVLYPEDGKPKGLELSAQHRSEIELSLSEPAIAPPLSLSAPELGSDEPFEFPPLRNAVSSTELMHERAMARLYQDAADEELEKEQFRKKSLERRPSLRETALERKPSLREIALERRHSFKESSKKKQPESEISGIADKTSASKNVEPKSILKKEWRLTSEERELIEFAKVRDRLRLKNDIKQPPPVESRIRPTNTRQESSMSSQISSYDGDPESEQYEGEVEESVEEEELGEEEMGEEEEMEIDEEEDGFYEESLEPEEDDEMPYEALVKPKTLVPEKTPPIPQHGLKKDIFEKEKSPIIIPRIAPKVQEEETYHPRSMVPTRGIVRALPVTIEDEEVPQPELPKITINEETEERGIEPDKRKLIPEERTEPKTKTKKTLLKKIGFGLKREKKKKVAAVIEDTVTPVATVVLPKPILKKKSLVKKKDKDKEKQTENEIPTQSENLDHKKKQVRIAEPGNPLLAVPTTDDPKLSPLTKARNQRLQRRQQSLDEEEEANRVLIYHYSDIVKEFGGPRKPPPKLYLNINELEAHASDTKNNDDNSTVVSDQEERGSAPDMSEVEVESIPEIPLEKAVKVEVKPTPKIKEKVIEKVKPKEIEKVKDKEELIKETTKTKEKEIAEVDEQVNEASSKESLVVESRQTSSERTSHSPIPRVLAPEEAVRSTMDYLTDVAIFIFACWLYLFKSEIYVIPVLILLVYRQIHDSIRSKYNAVRQSLVDKIPNTVLNLVSKEESKDEKNENS